MDSTPTTTVPPTPAPEPTVEISLTIVIKMPEGDVEDFLADLHLRPDRGLKSRTIHNGEVSLNNFFRKIPISWIAYEGIDL